MAKKMTSSFAKFNINQSSAMKNIEDIYNAPLGEVPPTEANVAEVQPAATELSDKAPQAAQEPLSSVNGTGAGLKPLKSEKGVKILLPMDYYFKLVRIKACTGKSLQELAAQGVMEYIDKFDQES